MDKREDTNEFYTHYKIEERGCLILFLTSKFGKKCTPIVFKYIDILLEKLNKLTNIQRKENVSLTCIQDKFKTKIIVYFLLFLMVKLWSHKNFQMEK